jgi:2-amino-4-hydroxy-6-hydroxymethyldihydropteridine diphosphokinase
MSKSRSPGRPEERVFLALGGNVGEVAQAMRSALNALAADGTNRIVAVSSLWSTPPWGVVDQPDFLNAVVEIRTELSPMDLLEAGLEIERMLKRQRRERWGPRTLDIDIVLFGDRVVDETGLQIPHPRAGARAFVMVPLAEIAPDLAGRLGRPDMPDGMRRVANGDWWK